jgi:hypothetical protein
VLPVSAHAVAAPVGVTDFETARVQVWRPGFGWVDRPMTLCEWHRAVVDGLMSEPGTVEGDRAEVAAAFVRSCCDCQAVA